MKNIILKVLFAACIIMALSLGFVCFYASASESVLYPFDDFTTMGTSEFSAHKMVGISTDKSKVHGAIPSETWGSPVSIANESYLIYKITSEGKIGSLFTEIKANLWNQNDETAAMENAVKIYVGETETDFTLIKSFDYTAAPDRNLTETVELTNAVKELSTAYVKVELVQSKSHCGNTECANGGHKCGKTVASPDGKMDIWHFGVKLYSVRFLEEIVVDKEQPVPNGFKAEIPNSVPTSKFYTFPEIVFTDKVDGVVDYTITMTDPNKIEKDLGINAEGFLAEYEGIYTFEISASDKSGNTYTDRFSVNCMVGEGLPRIGFNKIPEKNGRQGVEFQIEPLVYFPEEVESLEIYALDPKGNRVEIENGKFTPEEIGEYRIKYEATNAEGSSKLLVRVYVKYDVKDGNVYEMSKEVENWKVENLEGAIAKNDDGLYISDEAYSPLPFDLNNGIKVTFTLPEEAGSWSGIYFTRTAGFNRYYLEDKEEYKKNDCAPGLYVLIYKENDSYYCNVDYVGLSKTSMEVVNHFYCGNGPEITVALIKVENDDKIAFYINGQKNENYELNYSVNSSVCSDNESFSYIGFGNLSAGGITLKSIEILDNVKPVINLSSPIPESFKVGEKYVLPNITAIDACDGEVQPYVRVFSPDGKLVPHDKEMSLDKEGVWYCIVKAEDSSGNVVSEVYALNVGNVSKIKTNVKGGCSSSICDGLCAVCVVMAFSAVYIIIKRKKLNG